MDTGEQVPSDVYAKETCENMQGYQFGFFRSSSRSLTGQVLVAEFDNLPDAQWASKYWSSVLPRCCKGAALRRLNGSRFSISIPVVG
ncbi:MAG: hypothetical protein AAF639_44900 [Chloroflexota bacterium]